MVRRVVLDIISFIILKKNSAPGSYNIRRQENGEVLFRGHLGASIAGILRADYRMDGQEEVIIISEAGEMVAYLPTGISHRFFHCYLHSV